jgi:hypothetical protein
VEPNRDPRLGRNEEGYSEDPYLCARIADEIVRGAQGYDVAAPDKVVAGLCHYPGQSQPASGLERGAMHISDRMLGPAGAASRKTACARRPLRERPYRKHRRCKDGSRTPGCRSRSGTCEGASRRPNRGWFSAPPGDQWSLPGRQWRRLAGGRGRRFPFRQLR